MAWKLDIDPDKCNLCSGYSGYGCKEICPLGEDIFYINPSTEKMDVIKEEDGTCYECLGCGVCVDVCQEEAITLEEV